jgi:hypothetical protein
MSVKEKQVTSTESVGAETPADPGLLRRVATFLVHLMEGEGPSDTSGYYVTSSQWPPGVPKELELPPDVVSRELDKAFDEYYDAAMASLATVNPDASTGDTRPPDSSPRE